ncbi:MAG: hypothetical protein ABSD64_14210, partial [Terriglobales bacterium]
MKHVKLMPIMALLLALLLLSAGSAAAQSLGDYARALRKNKVEPNSAAHHYDNDNLPTGAPLSVVGPPPAAAASTADDNSAKPPAADQAAPAGDRQKAADELKDKLAQQKEKIAALNHELDLDQRELRVRSAA